MPTKYRHLRQAFANESFVNTLDPAATRYAGWAVIGLFYAALHYVTALLHRNGCTDASVNSHDRRLRQLQAKLPLEAGLYQHYRHLKDDSEDARYDCVSFTSAQVMLLQSQQFAAIKQRV
jgi:hypothetical protein